MKVGIQLIAGVVIVAAITYASTVFAPLALALFVIAIVWPLQDWLQARMPKLLALAITLLVTLAVGVAFASLVVWGFGRVLRSLVSDAARYEAIYQQMVIWLDGHDPEKWAPVFPVGQPSARNSPSRSRKLESATSIFSSPTARQILATRSFRSGSVRTNAAASCSAPFSLMR